MLNSEVIFLEIVTGTSDFGGNLLKIFPKKKKKKTRPDFLGIYGRSRRATNLKLEYLLMDYYNSNRI